MKGNSSFIGSLLLMICSCLWFSCSEKQDAETTSPDRGPGFTLDQIKRTFVKDYAAVAMTRGGLEPDEIKMGDRFDPITMMEELMHIYQGLGTPGFSKEAKLNYEVEAKLTWYIYCRRNNHTEDFSSSFGGTQGVSQFRKMANYILDNDVNDPEFIEAFDDAARCLRNIAVYRNEKNYPYDPCKMDCENLMKLLKQCNK